MVSERSWWTRLREQKGGESGIPVPLVWILISCHIDQFQYIKIQSQTTDLRTRLWGINKPYKLCIYSREPDILRSIVLGWISIYQNWSITLYSNKSQYNPVKIKDLLHRLIFAPRALSFTCSVEYMLRSVQDFIVIVINFILFLFSALLEGHLMAHVYWQTVMITSLEYLIFLLNYTVGLLCKDWQKWYERKFLHCTSWQHDFNTAKAQGILMLYRIEQY